MVNPSLKISTCETLITGCAYADGLVTAEQAVLTGYARGTATKNTKVPPGLMAAVGLSAENCQQRLPKDITIACDNSDDNVTISGPETAMKQFLTTLTNEGIFNRVVDTAGNAFHSYLLAPAEPRLMQLLNTFIPEAKPRTKRWLPSAVEESQWDSDLAKINSAAYHCHNYLNTVQFRQCVKKIPQDAIVFEIAPRGLLQAILRRSLPKSCTLLTLSDHNAEDNELFLFRSIGKFFNAGGQVDLVKFYPGVESPVGAKTPSVSHLLKWDHSIKWHVPRFLGHGSFGRRFQIDMTDQENKFLEGHIIDGKVILPASGYAVKKNNLL